MKPFSLSYYVIQRILVVANCRCCWCCCCELKSKSYSMPRSCAEAHSADPALQSGNYYVDPDGTNVGDDPIYVYCDMSTGTTLTTVTYNNIIFRFSTAYSLKINKIQSSINLNFYNSYRLYHLSQPRRWWVTTVKRRSTQGTATIPAATRVQSITQVELPPDNWPLSSTSQPVAASQFELVDLIFLFSWFKSTYYILMPMNMTL